MPSSFKSLNVVEGQDVFSIRVSAAHTIEELTAVTPKTFQVAFTRLYKKFADLAVKLSHVRSTVSNFVTHQQKGTFPPIIMGSFKEPSVQVSKEFAENDKHATFKSACQSGIRLNREQALSACLDLKQVEVRFLEELMSSDNVGREANEALQTVWKETEALFRIPGDKNGVGHSNFILKEYHTMKAHHKDFVMKAIAIGMAKHQRELASKMAKLSIKKSTDVEMQDASASDTKRYIDQAILRAFKAKDKRTTPKSMSTVVSSNTEANLPSRQAKFQGRETEPEEKTAEGQAAPSRKRKWQWEQEAEAELQEIESRLSRKRFKPRDPHSYPETFFTSSHTARVMFSLLHSSTDFVDSLPAYKAEVFQGEVVSLPRAYSQSLALNGKFILHTQKESLLVQEAHDAFRRTVRIKWFFRHKYQDRYFNPKFYVKTDWNPPTASAEVEKAISLARGALACQVSFHARDSRPLNPEINSLRAFLAEKNFLVKITDKNLGLAVVTKDWYQTQCRAHLAKTNNYRAHSQDVFILMEKLRKIWERHYLHGSIVKFLEQSSATVPRFHVIPKVHKEPWSSRPIVPSHSWITSRASQVVDYFLQKALKQIYWVLQSTRDFVRKLRTTCETRSLLGCTLVTGDVREMYTNIPIHSALAICKEALKQVDLEGNSVDGVYALLEYTLTNNFFQYEGKVFWQHEGIAMGTSCAPAVANLYLAVYEQKILDNAIQQGLVFYGRYIDDIFLIFHGDVETTRRFLAQLVPPHLEILWEISASCLPFLDVEARLLEGKLKTSVYTKRLNRYMYVPFSSAHPISVKRALVKGERSRFHSICSDPEDLQRIEQHFRVNLYRRGYPPNLLRRWFSEDVKASSDRTSDKMFYPSVYNPVWEYINMREVETAFQDGLVGKVDTIPPALLRRIMLSLKRGGNMYDMYNRSNLTVLEVDARC